MSGDIPIYRYSVSVAIPTSAFFRIIRDNLKANNIVWFPLPLEGYRLFAVSDTDVFPNYSCS